MKTRRSLFLLVSVFILGTAHSQVPEKMEEPMPEGGYDHIAVPDFEEEEGIGYSHVDGKFRLMFGDKYLSDVLYDDVHFAGPGFIVKKEGKFGYVYQDGKITIPLKYDSICYNTTINDGLVVTLDSRSGVMSNKGIILLPMEYKRVVFGNPAGQFLVENKNGELQLLGTTRRVLEKGFQKIMLFHNGAVIKRDTQFAIVTETFHSGFVYDSFSVKSYSPQNYNNKKSGYKPPDLYREHQTLNLLVVIKKGKAGIVDSLGRTVVPVEFDAVEYQQYKHYYQLRKERKWGLYLPTCRVYIPADYDMAYMDGISFIELQIGSKHGLLNHLTGEMILPLEYDEIRYSGDIYVITQNKKSGVLDRQGKMIFPVVYDQIEHLGGLFDREFDDLYRIKVDTLYGVLHKDGSTILAPQFSAIYSFEDRFFRVEQNGDMGLYDINGNQIQPPVYDWIGEKGNGHIRVYFTWKNGFAGVLDSTGKTLFDTVFSRVSSRTNTTGDLVAPSPGEPYKVLQHRNGAAGVLNTHAARLCLPLEYSGVYQAFAGPSGSMLFLAKKANKFGIVDEENRVIIPFVYDSLDAHANELLPYYEDIAAAGIIALKGGKWGVIDLNNQIRLPFDYEAVAKLSQGQLYKTRIGKHFELRDGNNKILNPGPFDEISQFEVIGNSNEYTKKAMTFYKGKMRVIDAEGRFLTEPVDMVPHVGYTSFAALKADLALALDNGNDELLYTFAARIAPSDQLMYFVEDAHPELYSWYIQYDREELIRIYYRMLLEYKHGVSQGYFNPQTLLTEDYTIYEEGFVTNTRHTDWAYSDTRILEKILRNSIKINGYWVSSAFANERIQRWR